MPLDIFVDVEARSIVTESINSAIADVGSLQIGEGSKVFRGDQSGIWLGAEKWADAPFRVDMEGNVVASSATFTGYVEDLGGSYDSASSGARVRILPTSNIGLQVVDGSANNVFIAYVGGSQVGDVEIGDYSGGNGIRWDDSAGDFLIRGDMNAGNITGVTIEASTFKTAASGVRVQMDASDAEIALYDSGDDKVLSIDEGGGDSFIESGDGRDLRLTSDTDIVKIEDIIEFPNTKSSAPSIDWGIYAYESGGDYGIVYRLDGGNWTSDATAGLP